MAATSTARRQREPRATQKARRHAAGGPTRARHALLSWNKVALSSVRPASAGIGRIGRPPGYIWLLVGAALLLHVALLWYLRHGAPEPEPHKRTELKLDFVQPPTPPPPPPPKIEPPKPQPRHAQVLPPIQTAQPIVSNDVTPSPEPPVAVAPIATAPPPAPPPPLPVTAPFGKAGYQNNPAPDYPAIAARQGWGGTVTLRVHVLADGKPDQVQVQTTSGHAPLDQEAIRAVKAWTFAPAKRGDAPIDGWATVPIEFKL
jgi:periplasmic protein TonB